METLFTDKETFQKERPTILTELQKVDFYMKMANELMDNGHSDDDDNVAIADDLKRLYPFRDNGYEMSKKLEDNCSADYHFDVSFCEWLGCLNSEYDDAIAENVKLWVNAHEPKPFFKIGDELLINISLNYQKMEGQIVYVTGFKKETAHYLIANTSTYQGGTVITYEKVESNCILNPTS